MAIHATENILELIHCDTHSCKGTPVYRMPGSDSGVVCEECGREIEQEILSMEKEDSMEGRRILS